MHSNVSFRINTTSRLSRVTVLAVLAAIEIALLLPIDFWGASSSCSKLIPPGGTYDVLRIQNSQEFHQTLDDYMYKKDYKTHNEAISDGFSIGFMVYGEPLKADNTFTKEDKDKWFSEYKQKTHLQVDAKASLAFEQLVLNHQVVKDISQCIIQTEGHGVVAELESTGDCTATFTARYIPSRDGERPPVVTSRVLSVQGGKCDEWPKSVVSFGSTFVNCERNKRDALTVTINTKDAEGKSDHIDAMTPLGPEPTAHDEYGDTFSKPATQNLTLYYRDFPEVIPKVDLRDYRFLASHDISSPSGGPIQNIDVLHCENCGGHFWLCDGICQRSLFERISESSWRMFVYYNSDQPPPRVDLLVHYLEKEKSCVANCGSDVAHANWVAENSRTCMAAIQPPIPKSYTLRWLLIALGIVAVAVILFLVFR